MSENIQPNLYFLNLVISLSQAGMQQLGKIANPLTGKVEKNLDQAKSTIDILEMLKEKTNGNLTKEEAEMIGEVLANLQLNYVDEANKKVPTEKKEETKKEEKKDTSSQPEGEQKTKEEPTST